MSIVAVLWLSDSVKPSRGDASFGFEKTSRHFGRLSHSRSLDVLLLSTLMPALGPKLLARLTVQAFRVGLIRAGFGHRLFFGRHRFGVRGSS